MTNQVLDSLRPTKHQRFMDLASAAGLDVSSWAYFKGGETKAASNPAYCYEWCLRDQDLIVLNLWHDEIEMIDDKLLYRRNYRDIAASNKGVRRTRSTRMDQMVQYANDHQLTVRVIVLGRGANGKGTDRRLLDSEPWTVVSYDASNGECVIERGDIFSWAQFGDDPEAQQFKEGDMRTRFVVHRRREQKLRRDKLREYKRINGRIFCEVPRCNFDFGQKYGAIGDNYAHVHHKIPLSTAPLQGYITRIEDLAVVCPNCHAMIHAGGECRSIDELIPL
jgi:5-methylcytosine-specific restriction endonuclease McrA